MASPSMRYSFDKSIFGKQIKDSVYMHSLQCPSPYQNLDHYSNKQECLKATDLFSVVKPAHAVTTIKQSPVLKGHLALS